jgi:hypothetical protein
MPMPSAPNAKLRARIAFLCLLLAFAGLSIGAYYVGDLGRFQPRMAARESHSAPQGPGDSGRIDAAPRQHPANPFQQLLAMATRAADDTAMASEKLSSEVDQPAIPGGINLGTASRAELEALRGNLKTAEANATAFMPRYAALLKSERDTVENDARALHVEKESLARLLDNLDQRQAEMTAFMARLMSARAEFYRAYENYVAVLAGEFGNYKVVDGQFIFPFQRSVDRYNVAGHAMTVAAKSVAELEQERQNLKQSQQAAWLRFVNGQ